jgi:hypothetical protein
VSSLESRRQSRNIRLVRLKPVSYSCTVPPNDAFPNSYLDSQNTQETILSDTLLHGISFSTPRYSQPTASMPKSCGVCNVVASEGVTFSYCGACQSVMYCSKVCQKKDWKAHKQICKFLNAGDGAIQVGTDLISMWTKSLYTRGNLRRI